MKKYFLILLIIQTLVQGAIGQEKEKAIPDTSRVKLDTLQVGESKSGYQDIKAAGGMNSVAADLKIDDIKKDSWLSDIVPIDDAFSPYYSFKRFIKSKYNIAIGTDYMFLNQVATFSNSDKYASSGVFRFYGNWKKKSKKNSNVGNLVFKIENRHKIGRGETPRNLGYEAGAALSTASYKDFSWGLTNFYWKQFINDKYAIIAGIMDPGDWLDLYPLLNPFKFYLNEAFFNSPAMALPNQGFGIVVAARDLLPELYLAGGIHDANGEPTMWIIDNFASFFGDREFMYWVEAGWNPEKENRLVEGETLHVMYWHQDERSAKFDNNDRVERSWGLNLSVSHDFNNKLIAFVRAGYSEGNGAIMRHLIQLGASYRVVRHDIFGIGFHWGAPSDRNYGNQAGLEAYYAAQITDHLNVMPDFQLTFNPSFNESKNIVGIFSVVRVRYAL